MKTLYKQLVWLVFLGLIAGNIYIFVDGIKLSSQINNFETGINKLHEENIELEKKASSFDSYQYAVDMAKAMDFSQKATPMYLNNLNYALNR